MLVVREVEADISAATVPQLLDLARHLDARAESTSELTQALRECCESSS
jgi:hypothetical protein